MAFKRYFPIADTSIVNYGEGTNEDSRYANVGGADTLEVYSIHERIYSQSAENSRILLNFDWDQVIQDRERYVTPSSGSVRYYLRLFNVQHIETLPKNFELAVHPLSGTWVEGTGLDLETYNDYGFTNDLSYEARGTNWIYRDYNETWNSQGGDYLTGSSNEYDLRQYFDDGVEDLEIDVTNIIEDYITGSIGLDGLIVKLSTDYENLYPDIDIVEKTYYTKRFSARTSEYFFKRPTLEARWEPTIRDNYPNLYLQSAISPIDASWNYLCYYNKYNGKLHQIPQNVIDAGIYLKIISGSTELSQGGLCYCVEGAVEKEGICSFKFLLDPTEHPEFWSELLSGNVDYKEAGYEIYTTAFGVETRLHKEENTLKIYNLAPEQSNDSEHSYVFNISNLKPKYSNKEIANFKIYSREVNWKPSIYTISVETAENKKHDNLYYKITRVKDGLTIADYNYEDYQYTRVGYDRDSNILEFDMSVLEPGYMYEIKFALLSDTHFDEAKDTFRFRVVEQ